MFLQRLQHCNSRLQEIEASLDDVPMRIKFVSQLLSERVSDSDSMQDHQTWRTLSLLHFHRIQIHSANEALLMLWHMTK